MTAMTWALREALLHFLWQGLVVALLFRVAMRGMKQHTPEARYRVGCTALAVLALLPLATLWLVFAPSRGLGAIHLGSGQTESILDAIRVGSPAATTLSGPGILRTWAVPVWLLGVALCSLRLLWGYRYVQDLRCRATPAEHWTREVAVRIAGRMGVTRSFRVMTSTIAGSPAVVGWLRPVILVPVAALAGLSPAQLEAVLAHEIGHIRRHDYLINLLQSMLEALLFYHPAVWWISACVRRERELCCDDLAVRISGDVVLYARALSQLERLRHLQPRLALGAADGSLVFRIRRLCGREDEAAGRSIVSAVLALSLAIVALLVNMSTDVATAQTRSNVTASQAQIERAAEASDASQNSAVGQMALNLEEAASEGVASQVLTVPPPPPPPPAFPEPPSPPSPPPPPNEVSAGASLQSLELENERLGGPDDTVWVLFRGDQVMTNGSSADEAEARLARGTRSGDFLWFRRAGETGVIQDPEFLDEVNTLLAPIREVGSGEADRRDDMRRLAEEIAALREQMQGIRVSVSDDLQAQVRALSGSLRDDLTVRDLPALQESLGALQASLAALQSDAGMQRAALARQERDLARREAELARLEAMGPRLRTRALGEASRRIADRIGRAVESGRPPSRPWP